MTDTTHVRVAGSQFRYDGEQYTEGDTLEVHVGCLEKHPRTLEPVDGDGTGQDTTDDGDGDPDAEAERDSDELEVDPHPDDLTVAELEERVQDVDDVALLEAILEAEQEDGSPRSTAVEAIKDRINELEG